MMKRAFLNTKLKALAKGASSRALSTGKGKPQLYVWGCGDEGQLGLGGFQKEGIRHTYEELLPKKIPAFDDIALKQISFGFTHSAAVDEDGQLWTWGSNKYGKLGLGQGDNEIANQPVKVKELAGVKIAQVSCGESHTAAIDEHGRVFTWGWGGSFLSGPGGLGLGDQKQHNTPQLVELLEEESVRIEQIECGDKFTVGLSSDGEIWCWGNGEYGRLGNGSTSHAKVPEPLAFFEDTVIKQISVGHAFTLALTDAGAVYCWGRNDQGQLGLGGSLTADVFSMENLPAMIESLEGVSVKSVHGGVSHAAAVTTEGKLYIWGMRLHLEPTEITSLSGKKVVSAECGGQYTAALTEDGELYTFGSGRSSSLGADNRNRRAQPALVDALKGLKVQSIACGNRHAGAIVQPSSSGADKDFSFRA